jgi:hypothetical protein
MYLSAVEPRLGALGELDLGLCIVRPRRGLLRDDVLAHVAGPAGALGLCAGIGRQPGVEGRAVTRASASPPACALALPAVNAVNQALNEAESSVRVTIPLQRSAARLRALSDALASVTDDSVLHLAAA